MSTKVRVKIFVNKAGYMRDWMARERWDAKSKQTYYDHAGYEIIVPVYRANESGPHFFDYNTHVLTNEGLEQLFLDFVGISYRVKNGEDAGDVIIENYNQWGTITYAEDFGGKNLDPMFYRENAIIYSTIENILDASSLIGDLLKKNASKKNKEVREEILKNRDNFTADIVYEDIDGRLEMVVEPLNVIGAIHYQLVNSIANTNPIRICPVCNKFYQRKITAKQCSDKCKSLKSARKIRSKKK